MQGYGALITRDNEVASLFGKKDWHVTLSHHKITDEVQVVLNLLYGIDAMPVINI
jgi:hypothetical protein